jgi:hypothetical protein
MKISARTLVTLLAIVMIALGATMSVYGYFTQPQFPNIPNIQEGFATLKDNNGNPTTDWHYADINNDGKVDLLDAQALSLAWGSHAANYDYLGELASPNWNPKADLNKDGVAYFADKYVLQEYYGYPSGLSIMPSLLILDIGTPYGQEFWFGLLFTFFGIGLMVYARKRIK